MKNILKNYWRFLQKNKTLSIINIGGFAISMSALFIILSFVIGERNVNRIFPKEAHIYRIVRADSASEVVSTIPVSLYEDVKNKIPDIDAMGLYTIRECPVMYKNKTFLIRMGAVNDDFLDMFSVEYISSRPAKPLNTKGNTIITESLGKKIFGSVNPLGQVIHKGESPLTVVGVMKDLPKNASFNFEMAVNYDFMNILQLSFMSSKSAQEDHTLVNAFVQLKPNANPSAVNGKIAGMVRHWGAFQKNTLSIEPLRKVYFKAVEDDQMDHANVKLIYLLSSIAVIILFMSIFNYVNLTVSKSYDRFNEIGIKKATGAGKREIFIQLMAESLLISLIAMVLAVALTALFAGFFSGFLGQEIHFDTLIHQPFFIVIIGSIILFTALISGVYPAFVLSGFTPLQLINKQRLRSAKRSGEWVIGLQFLFTIILITSLLLIQKQMDFVKYKNMGFDKEHLVKLRLQGNAWKNGKLVKESLLSYPEIRHVAGSNGSPMNTTGWSSGQYDVNGAQKFIETLSFSVDKDFLKTFNIGLVAGRNITERDSANVCLINEHLYKELEWKGLDGKTFGGCAVIGVTSDFNYQTLYIGMGNLVLHNLERPSILSIKISGDIGKAIKTISKVYGEYERDIAPDIVFYDEWIQAMYKKDDNQAKGIRLFTILAIVISCLGAIGVVEQLTRRKIKEIGVRKINGATIADILGLLNYRIFVWVLLAYVVAVPVTYLLITKWLEGFAYKTSLSWWIFALAGVLALAIALLTVSWQSWRAATRNPVEALRYE